MPPQYGHKYLHIMYTNTSTQWTQMPPQRHQKNHSLIFLPENLSYRISYWQRPFNLKWHRRLWKTPKNQDKTFLDFDFNRSRAVTFLKLVYWNFLLKSFILFFIEKRIFSFFYLCEIDIALQVFLVKWKEMNKQIRLH